MYNYMENKPSETMTYFTVTYFVIGFLFYYSFWLAIIVALLCSISIIAFLYLSSKSKNSIPIHVSLN